MTIDYGNLFQSLTYLGNDSVVFGDNFIHKISSIGFAQLQIPHGSFILNDVLIVPLVTSNLLFVKKFAKDNLCSIEFDLIGFFVKDL